YSDFRQITRAHSCTSATDDPDAIAAIAKNLLASTDLHTKGIRLLGISLSGFTDFAVQQTSHPGGQLSLFPDCGRANVRAAPLSDRPRALSGAEGPELGSHPIFYRTFAKPLLQYA